MFYYPWITGDILCTNVKRFMILMNVVPGQLITDGTRQLHLNIWDTYLQVESMCTSTPSRTEGYHYWQMIKCKSFDKRINYKIGYSWNLTFFLEILPPTSILKQCLDPSQLWHLPRMHSLILGDYIYDSVQAGNLLIIFLFRLLIDLLQ